MNMKKKQKNMNIRANIFGHYEHTFQVLMFVPWSITFQLPRLRSTVPNAMQGNAQTTNIFFFGKRVYFYDTLGEAKYAHYTQEPTLQMPSDS